MTLRVLAGLGLAVSLAATEPLGVTVDAYRRAAASGQVGGLSGHVITEGPRPGASPRPVSEVGITLVPHSQRLLEQLWTIRGRARRDVDAYRDSAVAIAEARQAWERALWRAGAAELVRFTAVDPDGRFAVEGLPAGRWMLMAQRAVFVPKGSPTMSKRDRETFASRPRFIGYYAVTIWVQELTIAAGQWIELQLTDRNAWMTALAEEREPSAGR